MKAMSKALEAEWSSIVWSEIQTKVIKLQTKIYEASKSGNKPLVVKLQKTLISSFSARLMAVRRVTQENKGKRTAGIDGVKSLTPQQRIELAEQLRLDGKSAPLRRVEIPKPGKKENRPLGIPTIEDRAKQALAKLALEPEWEALFEPNSYGFRPGRSCHDAIEAIELSIRKKPKYLIDADLKGCFDNIDHEALIQKLKTFPDMEKQIRAWLKSGVLIGDVFHKTVSGTPQGGVISPLLANIALHGFESYISSEFPVRKTRIGQPKGKMKEYCDARVIRYADDLVIFHEEEEVIKAALEKTKQWMANIGLSLNEQKTKLCHTLEEYEGEKPGFNFLGFHIQSFSRGKNRAGKNTNGEPVEMVTKVLPSDKSIKQFQSHLKALLNKGQSQEPPRMIESLNWFIRGWGNYFKSGSHSHEVFSKVQHSLYKVYLNWGRKKFSQRGDGYICSRIFFKSKESSWNFGWKEGDHLYLVEMLYSFEYKHYTKVQGIRSPYDGDWVYWATRRGDHPLTPKDIRFGLKNQKGRCSHCQQLFTIEDYIEVHHIDGNRNNNKRSNKTLVHLYCHDAIHRENAGSITDSI